MFTHGRPGPHQRGRSVCIRELQDVDAECFLWDLTLALTALSETSASHVLTWVEFHNKLPISVRYRTENTAAALGLFTNPPLFCRDVTSCPVQAVLTKRSGFSCGCFNGPQGPQPVFKARWDPVTAELMFPGRLGGGGLFEAHRKGGVWLWPSGWRQRQQNWGTPVTTATWACRRPPCGRVATGHVGDNQPICAASLSSCMLAVMECN